MTADDQAAPDPAADPARPAPADPTEGTPAPAEPAEPESADGPPAIELRGITKRFPGVVANSDVNLVVRRGEVHALVGENGAGKSTLMKTLYGMHQPDEGEILVGGTSLSGGQGGVLNTLIGVLIVAVLANGMILLGIPPYVQQAVQGLMIIAAVALSIDRKRLRIVK